jgi:hypothetical protein
MPTTPSLLITVNAYSSGTVPALDSTNLTFDTQGGNNGYTQGSTNNPDPGNYSAGTQFYSEKYYTPNVPTVPGIYSAATGVAPVISIRQTGETGRRANRHCRVEYKKSFLQYFSISQQRWIKVGEDYLQPFAARESAALGGTAPADAFALPNGDISIRSGSNARLVAGTTGPETVGGGGPDSAQLVGYRMQTVIVRQYMEWADVECVLVSTPMRAVGPGSEKTEGTCAYVANLDIQAFVDSSAGNFLGNSPGRTKPVTAAWQNFYGFIGPIARIATNPPLGSTANPFPVEVNISGATSLADVRASIKTAITANPTGPLNLLLVPFNKSITDTGSTQLDSTDGFTGTRAINLDFNEMTVSAAQTFDTPASRLPIFVETLPAKGAAAPAPGTNFKVVIRDTRWQSASTGEKALLGVTATTLYCMMRLGWQQIKTTLINPVRAGGITTWEVPTALSDFMRSIWPFATQQEYVFEATQIYSSFALWPLYAESPGSDVPALTLFECKQITVQGLTIRDRALGTKQWALDQANDGLNQNAVFFAGRWLPTSGIRVRRSDGVKVLNNNFVSLEGEGCTFDVSSLNYEASRNVFQNTGGNGLAKGVMYTSLDFLPIPYGVNGVFSKNAFYKTAQQSIGGSPIFATSGCVNLAITNNVIKDCPYSGISIGYPFSVRGASASPQYFQNQLMNVDINGNLLDTTMQSSFDGGTIYVKGPMVGGQIRNNTLRVYGPNNLNSAGTTDNYYGAPIGVGPGLANYPAPCPAIYFDNGAFGWVASGNQIGAIKYSYQTKLFLQSGNAESGADPTLTAGEVATASPAYTAGPTTPPLKANGIIDRRAWFIALGVAP